MNNYEVRIRENINFRYYFRTKICDNKQVEYYKDAEKRYGEELVKVISIIKIMTELEKRKINLIIVTGRCYKYKDNYYEMLDHLLSKNTITREWEGHVRYKNVLHDSIGCDFSRLDSDFGKKFEHITEQLL